MFDLFPKPEAIAAIAAVFSFFATAIAAYTAYMAPLSAAKLAESLRSNGDEVARRRDAKLHVFATLMASRKSVWSNDAVNAFNLIDIVYNDCMDVRTAWSELFEGYVTDVPEHAKEERLRKLLGSMAKELNLADELRLDDFSRVYRPNAKADFETLQMFQQKEALARYRGGASPSANSAPTSINANFPPKPI